MADPTQNADGDVIVLRNGDQASLIDEANVAGIIAQDGHLARVGSERRSDLHGWERSGRCGQGIISSIMASVSAAIRSTM